VQVAVESDVATVDHSDIRGSEPHNRDPSGVASDLLRGQAQEHNIQMGIDEEVNLPHISILNSTYEPLDAHLHLCLCRFERDEAALEVHTPWVRSQTNHFSSFSMLL
jgi:hypothetical protein